MERHNALRPPFISRSTKDSIFKHVKNVSLLVNAGGRLSTNMISPNELSGDEMHELQRFLKDICDEPEEDLTLRGEQLTEPATADGEEGTFEDKRVRNYLRNMLDATADEAIKEWAGKNAHTAAGKVTRSRDSTEDIIDELPDSPVELSPQLVRKRCDNITTLSEDDPPPLSTQSYHLRQQETKAKKENNSAELKQTGHDVKKRETTLCGGAALHGPDTQTTTETR